MFDLPKYGDGVCLARMAALLDALSVDRARLQNISVVVTGSNGKGSTAAFCAGIGRASGLRTGLFTSPHLHRFNERFQVDGTPIGDDALARLVSRIETAISEISLRWNEAFGAFEALFALACLHFQESECDFAVFEAGIGGRYDPVRLVGALAVCVTSVDYEHVELLGDSLELIVSDKSDACAAGGSIVYGENCRKLRPHILEYNHNRAASRRCSSATRSEIDNEAKSRRHAGQRFDFRFGHHDFRSARNASSRRVPVQQRGDCRRAVSCCGCAISGPGRCHSAIEAAVRSGLRDARWPGRLEVIQREPLTIVDVGHTPDAITQSLASLKAIHGAEGWILVVGVSRDKNTSEIAGALAPSFDTIICTAAHHKGAGAENIAAAVRKANPQADVRIAAAIEDAVGLSDTLAASSNRKIYVAGGLFSAIEYASVALGERACRICNFF